MVIVKPSCNESIYICFLNLICAFCSAKKSTNEKEVNVRVTSPEIDNDVNPPEVSNGALNAVHVDDHNLRSEYKESSLSQPDEEIPISGDQLTDAKQTKEMDMLTDAERIEQEKAITKAQAAFRGYLVTFADMIAFHSCTFSCL